MELRMLDVVEEIAVIRPTTAISRTLADDVMGEGRFNRVV